jgi:hypothetical protein
MATTIRVGDEVKTLWLVSNGNDFLWDVIGNSMSEGDGVSFGDGTDFEMTEEAYRWWKRWAFREQVILNEVDRLGEWAQNKVSELAGIYSDFDDLQDAEFEALGLTEE